MNMRPLLCLKTVVLNPNISQRAEKDRSWAKTQYLYRLSPSVASVLTEPDVIDCER